MRSLIRIATKAGRYPFTRAARKAKLKKGDEKKAVTAKKINKEEELAAENVKKDDIAKEKEDKGIDKEALVKMLASPPEEEGVHVTTAGLETFIRGNEYKVRLTKPAHGSGKEELLNILQRNRNMLKKSQQEMYDLYVINIKQNYAHNIAVELGENEKAVEEGKRELNKWNEKILRSGTQNALVARANIDFLIPLINIRGANAEFLGAEGLPIDQHISLLRDTTEKQACADMIPPEPEPETDEWTIQEFLTAAIIVIIIALLLRAFI